MHFPLYGTGGKEIFSDVCSSSKPLSEYIICARPFVGRRGTRGCRILLLFKGAGFDFSAAAAFLLCAILCGVSTGAETFILPCSGEFISFTLSFGEGSFFVDGRFQRA
jgi:hypothetical protein